MITTTAGPAARATILLVDDSSDNLVMMNDLLRDTFRVLAVTSGEKALRVACSDAPPDLILLDIMMPEMDGYEVCRRLGEDPRTTNIPVIFLTALADEEDEQKGLEVGAVDYITKPVSAPIMLARVRNHLAVKAMADAMRTKNVELELARTVADHANRAKTEFLSRMSHELRSPLNAIIGFAQLMESETPPPSASQRSSLTQILQGGWYLLDLINEILDLAVIESGRMTPVMAPVRLNELVTECLTLVGELARKRTITLRPPTGPLGVIVHADRTRLKQVLINLLTNAIKYNRPGGAVSVRCDALAGGAIRITVSDTGAGLPAEQVARLFESFNRLGREMSEEQGTGIGLVVSRRLMELMGGRIGAESTVGVGTDFWLELEPADSTARPSVLYVEDNPANLHLVEQLIQRRPELQMISAGDADYGIALARTVAPRMILMDINLPGIDGFEALKRLRADPATRHIPVVALSVNSQRQEAARGLAAGFFRYLTKPINVPIFMDAIDAALALAASSDRRTG